MSQRDETKYNKPGDDLVDIKSLISGADGGNFTLDEILSEYGHGAPPTAVPVEPSAPSGEAPAPEAEEELPWPQAKRRPTRKGRVVSFPGRREEEPQEPEEEPACAAEPEEQPAPPTPHPRSRLKGELTFPEDREGPDRTPEGEDPQEVSEEEPEEELEEDGPDNVVEFPQRLGPLKALWHMLAHRADDYAQEMFSQAQEEDDAQAVERQRELERLIPGTDREEEAAHVPPRRFQRPAPPPPPDTPPQELSRTYGRGLGMLRLRTLLVTLLFLPALYLVLAQELSLPLPAQLQGGGPIPCAVLAGLLAGGMLLGVDLLARGLARAFRGRPGMDTVTTLCCLFALADAALLAMNQDREGQLPYCAVALLALALEMHGEYHKRCAQRLSCRTAASASQPDLVTLDQHLWNGRDTYSKWQGEPAGFGSQIQSEDGAQRIYARWVPILLLLCTALSLLATVGTGVTQHLMWALTACLAAASSWGSALAYGRTFHKLQRRLAQSGAALAGWPGVADSRRGNRLLLSDTDLFPQGYVALNGIKIMPGYSMERVVGYTATLIRDAGTGLERLFHDLLRTQGAIFRRAEGLCCYEGGGVSARIRHDQVLVGSASFMQLMEIQLPQGLHVKNAVFCAINGELAGIFALSYTLPDMVFPALNSLLREKVSPVLATRDFNLIPAMLQQRFKLAADKMDFPPVERRRELSDPGRPHNGVLTAVLCREGLLPFAESVVAARRLRRSTRVGAALCCVGAGVGVVLAAYLVAAGAFSSISPFNLMVYQLLWLLPVWLLTGWSHRF